MGVTDLFLPGSADLNGIADDHQLYLTELVHSTFLQVNEIGTEAASISGVKIGLTSLIKNPTFHVDRPFLYIIRDDLTKCILFMGRLIKPPQFKADIGIFADGRFDRNVSNQQEGFQHLLVILLLCTLYKIYFKK